MTGIILKTKWLFFFSFFFRSGTSFKTNWNIWLKKKYSVLLPFRCWRLLRSFSWFPPQMYNGMSPLFLYMQERSVKGDVLVSSFYCFSVFLTTALHLCYFYGSRSPMFVTRGQNLVATDQQGIDQMKASSISDYCAWKAFFIVMEAARGQKRKVITRKHAC